MLQPVTGSYKIARGGGGHQMWGRGRHQKMWGEGGGTRGGDMPVTSSLIFASSTLHPDPPDPEPLALRPPLPPPPSAPPLPPFLLGMLGTRVHVAAAFPPRHARHTCMWQRPSPLGMIGTHVHVAAAFPLCPFPPSAPLHAPLPLLTPRATHVHPFPFCPPFHSPPRRGR